MEPTAVATEEVMVAVNQVIGLADTAPLLMPFFAAGIGIVVFVIVFGSLISAVRWLMDRLSS